MREFVMRPDDGSEDIYVEVTDEEMQRYPGVTPEELAEDTAIVEFEFRFEKQMGRLPPIVPSFKALAPEDA
ncbi:MAG: hypothetical protein ABW134_11920 [Candidatus Thiodiazotropha endolucinida]